jgi:hypothetical protein
MLNFYNIKLQFVECPGLSNSFWFVKLFEFKLEIGHLLSNLKFTKFDEKIVEFLAFRTAGPEFFTSGLFLRLKLGLPVGLARPTA